MTSSDTQYDLVISNGRVMDPESGLDDIRNVGINGGTIQAITAEELQGRQTIDAGGLIVAPGFIDLHSHGQLQENYELQVKDGVTTALELEAGAADIDEFYDERGDKAAINYGASVGHIPVRMKVMGAPEGLLPVGDAAHRAATEGEIAEMTSLIERGLQRGAIAVGFGLQYTPGASRWEALEMFRVAAKYGASCHVHIRGMGDGEPMNSYVAVEEVIAASAITGAAGHVVHLNSSGIRAVPHLLQMIGGAQSRGIDVTTECYPYTAALTGIESAIFDEGWQDILGIDHGNLEWTLTGERLTASTFAEFREIGGMVIIHMMPDDTVQMAVASPLTAIASDGFMLNGKGHPRSSGTYTRVLGVYVREKKALSLMEALRKMALMPAQRLESLTPAMKNKGRVRVGADADLAIFDPSRVLDMATYLEPTKQPEGMVHVIVNGVPVVEDGQLQVGATPGRAVRAPFN